MLGCSTSPALLKIYLEITLGTGNWKKGIIIPKRNSYLFSPSFADYQVLLVQDEEDVICFMVHKQKEEYTKAGLEINFC